MRPDASHQARHVGEALGYVFAAMDELELAGCGPTGALLVQLGDVAQVLDATAEILAEHPEASSSS